MLHVTGKAVIAKFLLGHHGPQLHPTQRGRAYQHYSLQLLFPLFLVSELLLIMSY